MGKNSTRHRKLRKRQRSRIPFPEPRPVSHVMLYEICRDAECECFGVTEHYSNGVILHRPFAAWELGWPS